MTNFALLETQKLISRKIWNHEISTLWSFFFEKFRNCNFLSQCAIESDVLGWKNVIFMFHSSFPLHVFDMHCSFRSSEKSCKCFFLISCSYKHWIILTIWERKVEKLTRLNCLKKLLYIEKFSSTMIWIDQWFLGN